MNRSDARLVVCCVLAVLVPAATLHFTAAAERRAAGLTAPPFAWPRILVAHLVTELPVGLIVARWLRTHYVMNEMSRGAWVAIGMGMAWLATLVGPGIGDSVASSEFGAAPLVVLRAGLALGLVLPWCIAALGPTVKPAADTRPGLVFGIGLGLAIIPCGMYAEAVAEARTEEARELLERERLVKADAVLTGLCELGSERPIGTKGPAELRKALAAHLPKLRRLADLPLAPSTPPPERIGRAVLLIQLDRLDEAAGLLQPLVPADDTATLMLATVYRDQERWASSDELYSTVLEKLLPSASTNAAAHSGCLTALEGLVFNARADRRPADAERLLNRGLDDLPANAAYCHFQLGKHYADGGRHFLAVGHLETAERLDPARYRKSVGRVLQTIRASTPACLP